MLYLPKTADNIYNIENVENIFALDLTVSDILTFEIVYLKKTGNGHEKLFSQWLHAIANLKIYESRIKHL